MLIGIFLFAENYSGAAFAHLQMLNKESRRFVNRAYLASGSSLNPAFHPWRRPSQMQNVKIYFQKNDTNTLIEYLKIASNKDLIYSASHFWIPVVENRNAPSAFLTDVPENILKSRDAPVMDTMFSFTDQVLYVKT